MKAVDESIARIMEQCVQGPMRACLALKEEQEKAAEASALLAAKQQTCEQELAALTTMLESGTSKVDLGNVDTVYDAVTLTDLGEASAMLSAKEAELHEIMQERLALNASLREISEESLRVGDSPETRLKSLHALAIDDVASFATKQASCNSAKETIAAEIDGMKVEHNEAEEAVDVLREVEAEARAVRGEESAVFVERLRELVGGELAKEAEFRQLVATTDSRVAEQHNRQQALVVPQKQLERAHREMARYEQAYGAAASGIREVENVTQSLLGRTDHVMKEHMTHAEEWNRSLLQSHVDIWQAEHALLQRQLGDSRARQAELQEEDAQLERQALRALRAGNKSKIKDAQERKKELAADMAQVAERLTVLEDAKAALFTDEIADTSKALNQPHPGGTTAASVAAISAAPPPPMLPPPLDDEEADSEEQEQEEESSELEIFMVLVGAKEPHGPLTVDETMTLLTGGKVLATSLSWCEGMDRWEPLRSSTILAPLFGDALTLKKSGPPALPPSLPALQ